MYYDPIKRRSFLKGVGASLALPFLPSLAPKAHAALGDQKSFIFISEDHGGTNSEHMFPERDPVNEQVLYSGSWDEGMDHRTRMESLSNFLTTRSSGLFPTDEEEFSPVLGSFLNSHLSKVNVLRGLDIMFYAGHHTGCYLGNFDGRVENAVPRVFDPMETIDQVIARSTSFYETRPVLPIMHAATGQGMSYAMQSGRIQQVNTEEAHTILSSILGADDPVSTTDEMTRYLNAIHQDYSQLVNGAFGPSRRLSAEDRLRIEEHMTLLDELTVKVGLQDGIGGDCGTELAGVTDRRMDYFPTDITLQEKIARWENTTDLAVGAIKCGACRIALLPAIAHPGYTGDWHGDIAHRQFGDDDPDALRGLVDTARFTAQYIFTRLIEKLDVDRGDGSTYLDNSLVVWTQEAGPYTHESTEMFAITAGSAGGYFNTGNYADYRNMSNLSHADENIRSRTRRVGLPYNRWLYTILKSMGIPDSEFAREGMYGYGDNYNHPISDWYANSRGHRSWPDRLIPDMSTPMPRIIA